MQEKEFEHIFKYHYIDIYNFSDKDSVTISFP